MTLNDIAAWLLSIGDWFVELGYSFRHFVYVVPNAYKVADISIGETPISVFIGCLFYYGFELFFVYVVGVGLSMFALMLLRFIGDKTGNKILKKIPDPDVSDEEKNTYTSFSLYGGLLILVILAIPVLIKKSQPITDERLTAWEFLQIVGN